MKNYNNLKADDLIGKLIISKISVRLYKLHYSKKKFESIGFIPSNEVLMVIDCSKNFFKEINSDPMYSLYFKKKWNFAVLYKKFIYTLANDAIGKHNFLTTFDLYE